MYLLLTWDHNTRPVLQAIPMSDPVAFTEMILEASDAGLMIEEYLAVDDDTLLRVYPPTEGAYVVASTLVAKG